MKEKQTINFLLYSHLDCCRTASGIGDVFARNAGYNQVGELNNIIILYPQAIAATGLGNPLGCWDWWEYTINAYG